MKKKIAAVDDNDDLLFTIKLSLGKFDKTLDIQTYNDPNAFLLEAQKKRFDLILLDSHIVIKYTMGITKFSGCVTTNPISFLIYECIQQGIIQTD